MSPIANLVTHYEPVLVTVSLLVATFASYVTLELARHVYRSNGRQRCYWWAAGSLAMGTGIWAMHFVGMLGLNLGFPLGYRLVPTLWSWVATVAAAGIALCIASRPRLTTTSLMLGSTSMAAGICTMHYIGMDALLLSPGISWDMRLVAASIAIAWVASAAALAIFFGLRGQAGARRVHLQLIASLVMGAAIGGMHYTGMAAANFAQGTICLSAGAISEFPLAVAVTFAALLMLVGTLGVTILDSLAKTRESDLARSLREVNVDLKEANDELKRKAFEDALTGLPNRALFDDRLQHAVSRIHRAHSGTLPAGVPAERIAVLFVDLDGFKPINDSFGHETGDQVLRELANRLKGLIRDSDTVARLGGDEFVVMVEARTAEAAAVALADRIVSAMQVPVSVSGHSVTLSCSIGVAIYPDHDASGQRLLACADSAMYAAKRAGGGTCVVYEPNMSGDAAEQILLQEDLRQAIERNELALHYQPKLDVKTGRVHGLEALLRWHHPTRGMVSPAVFIPLAERFGLIGTIGQWVIDEACAQLTRWHADGLKCRVAINLSPHQLRHPDLPNRIHDALARHGLDPSELVCEITESAMMENLEAERGVLDRIADLGVRLSIDDFGTGYSSLAHLRNIPARQIKIDRSFVVDLAESRDALAVLDAIVRLAHALGTEVVAEGVETVEQQDALSLLGCDLLQGYVIARPMPAEAISGWLDSLDGGAAHRSGAAEPRAAAWM